MSLAHGCKLGPMDCDVCGDALALPWDVAKRIARRDPALPARAVDAAPAPEATADDDGAEVSL